MISKAEKRVYKNTLALMLRTLITIPIGFFSVRLSLGLLGAADFGMVGVLSGFTAIALSMSSCIANSVKRYLCYSMVKSSDEEMRHLFSCSLQIYWVAAVCFVIGLEIFGCWMIKCKVSMPAENVGTALLFYQTVVVGFLIQFLGGAYTSVLTAYEDIDSLAVIGIGEVLVHFVLILLLYFWGTTQLMVLYGVVAAASYAFTAIAAYLIARRRYLPVISYTPVRDWPLTRGLVSFAFWQILCGISGTVYKIVSSVLLNNYFTSVINAAQGVGGMISGKISNFGQGFLVASQPRLMKLYAEGDILGMQNLFIRITKFSFFILLMLGVPIFIKLDYVLALWLKDPPPYSAAFAFLSFAVALTDVITMPGLSVIHATGKIRAYEIVGCFECWVFLPLILWGLKSDVGPLTVPLVAFIASVLGFFERFGFIKWLVPQFSLLRMLRLVVRYIAVPMLLLVPGLALLHLAFDADTFLHFCCVAGLGGAYAAMILLLAGFSSDERREFAGFLSARARRIPLVGRVLK